MRVSILPSLLLSCLLVAGCQAVNTTSGGAVGVDRKQYMFSLLSTDQVNQMYAQSYQQAISEAAGAGALVKDSADARRVQAISQRLIANCGPGGKIMVYTGLIEQLQLSD